MDITTLNTTKLENIDEKELNQLLLENLFPLENKQIRYYTSKFAEIYDNRIHINDISNKSIK